MTDIHSRPYRPNAKKCCPACVWGRGEHAEWCEENLASNATGTFTADEYRSSMREQLPNYARYGGGFTLEGGSRLRRGPTINVPMAELFPGHAAEFAPGPNVGQPADLYVSNIDYETKTVTLSEEKPTPADEKPVRVRVTVEES